MLNLRRHKDDFGIDATWVLFATSHDKSPCDGIGGTVKRLTARASLQRSYSDQISDVSSMLAFCKTNIPGIQFCYISAEKMKEVWLELKKKDLPWVRLYQEQEVTISSNQQISMNINVQQKMMHLRVHITGEACFRRMTRVSLRLNKYVACRYDQKW